MLMLDFFFLRETEKNIILCSYSDNMQNFIFDKVTHTLLLEDGRFWLVRMVMMLIHVIEPIWLDKRITDIDCQVAHKYQIKMLRFSHLVVDIKEITDDQALQAQYENILGLIEKQQEEFEICEFEIHEQQKKYVKHHQKYAGTDDEQQKDVHRSMMRHIGEEIDKTNKEKQEHEELIKSYEQEKQKLEEALGQDKTDG